MSNTTHAVAALPALSSEVAARAIAAAEKAVDVALTEYAEGDDSYVEVAEDDESHAYATAGGVEVEVYASLDGLHLCMTVKMGPNGKVADDGVEDAMRASADEAAADAYTYGCESGWRSAME